MNSSSCPRWLRVVAAAAACLVCALLGASLHPASTNLTALERELALAVEAREPGAVRELTQRLARSDDSPARRLRAAEIFLQLGLHDDLERGLRAIEEAGGQRERAAEKLRALAAMARGEHARAVRAWETYLRPAAGLTTGERVAALDSLARVLADAGRWPEALARLDERIALVEDIGPRLARAIVLVCLRRWDDAGGEFARLRRTASADPAVKPLLPAWERVERALPGLLAAGGDTPERRLDRGLVTLHAGLWRSAAEDFSSVAQAWPESRAALGLIARLASQGENDGPSWAARNITPEQFPMFAPSERALALVAELESHGSAWRALRACDVRIAVAGTVSPEERAEQARLLAELGFPWRALEDARSALKAAPQLLTAARVEIAALLAVQRDSEAFEAVACALRRHANADGTTDADLMRLAGLVWQKQGHHGAAVEAFTAWLRTHGSGEIFRARGQSLRFLQRFAESADDFTAAAAWEAARAGKSP